MPSHNALGKETLNKLNEISSELCLGWRSLMSHEALDEISLKERKKKLERLLYTKMKGFAFIKEQNGLHIKRILWLTWKKNCKFDYPLLCAFSIFPLVWKLLSQIHLPLYLSDLDFPDYWCNVLVQIWIGL